MLVAGGSTDVTTYFALRLAADGTAATGLTITNFDLQYTRSGVAPTAKVDATALAATDSAHADNKAIEIDATDQPGLYRVDWPDAAFAADVREVILTVKVATAFTEHLRVQIDPPVNVVEWGGTDVVAGAIPAVAADGAGGLPISDAGSLDLDTLLGRLTANVALASICTEARLAELDAGNIPTDLSDIQGATFSGATDSLEAIRNRGDTAWITGAGGTAPTVLQTTTIATLASQTSFTLTAGSSDDDAYNGTMAIITDQATSEQKAVALISDYTGASKTITLSADPAIFTMAATDNISVVAGVTDGIFTAGVTIGPLVASVTPANLVGSPAELQGFQLAAQDYVLTVLDSDDNPVDLSAKTLQFHVETLSDKSVTQFTVAAGSIVVSGGSNQIATVAVTAANTDIAADTYRWRLIDTAADDVLVFGNYVLLASTDGS